MSDADDKLKLEISKLELDIKEQKRLWIWKPANLLPLLTLLLGIGTLIWSFTSGFLDNSRLELSVKKENLTWEIYQFESKRDSLFKSNDSLIRISKKLEHDNDSVLTNYQSLKSEKEILNAALDKMKSDTRSVNEKVYTLTLGNAKLKFLIQDTVRKISVAAGKSIDGYATAALITRNELAKFQSNYNQLIEYMQKNNIQIPTLINSY